MREAFYQKRIIGAEEGVDIRDQLGKIGRAHV